CARGWGSYAMDYW
nr:immunoglobulin heavy chain junction region [Mus musculus]MBK4185573.1 immunoglobulin heavy chain junction region [Mus musculus]MBK4185574.1 immunoglobulin heavy chain junction region [Mus musculus]